MQFQGSFTIDRKENIHYNLFVSRNRLILMTVIVFAVITVMLGVTNYGQTHSLADAAVASLPMALAGSVLFLLINGVAMVMRVNQSYKQRQVYEFTQDILIDAEGVHAASERGSALLKWEKIEQIRESGRAFYLFLSKAQAYVLPKDQLKDKEKDAALIRSLVREHLDGAKLKIRR